MRRLLGLLILSAGMAMSSHAQEVQSKSSIAKTDLATCIREASIFHKVNDTILEAILRIESRLRPETIHKNTNDTIDIGIAGMNSVHLAELSQFGIGQNDLLNPCIGTYVGAWHLAKKYKKYGNTWQAVGAYHSETPIENQRYQNLIYQEVQKILGRTNVSRTQ
jgi:hypothetical protein